MGIKEKLDKRFNFIYGDANTKKITENLSNKVETLKAAFTANPERWNEEDIVLITYGDSIITPGEAPLKTLNKFINSWLKGAVSYIHILPFFPYSSDDGFSVIDYEQVNPELGDWSDVEELSKNYKLMFDLVINHISQHSNWFQQYKKGEEPGKHFFIETDPSQDLSQVVRPRSLPLLTPVQLPDGKKHVWTTFSDDQIDLNFANPKVMEKMVEIFLLYVEKGASMIRLDAIAFLWKELGTNCLHLPQTHEFVKLLRDICDYLRNDFILLTETNVPNKENLSYFGNNDEAHMVYQFSLPPLLLNTLFSENSEYLTKWAESLEALPPENTFFNFTASHDGVGVRPLEGLVPQNDLITLVEGMKGFGGKVNTKRNPDGSDSPYELNITYFDAMQGTLKGTDDLQAERFICSQTIMMGMQGVPAFYIHSLLGTKNYTEGIAKTGMNRTINRRKWELTEIERLLDTDTHHTKVLKELVRRIKIRKSTRDFHPNNNQEILNVGNAFFAFTRNNGRVVCLSNITTKTQVLNLSRVLDNYERLSQDKISGQRIDISDQMLKLGPYQTCWLSQ